MRDIALPFVGMLLLFGLPLVYVVWAFWSYDPSRDYSSPRLTAFFAALNRTFGIYVRSLFWLVVFAVLSVVGFYLLASAFDWINSLTVRGLLLIIAVLLLLVLFRLRR